MYELEVCYDDGKNVIIQNLQTVNKALQHLRGFSHWSGFKVRPQV